MTKNSWSMVTNIIYHSYLQTKTDSESDRETERER